MSSDKVMDSIAGDFLINSTSIAFMHTYEEVRDCSEFFFKSFNFKEFNFLVGRNVLRYQEVMSNKFD